jgi:NAD-dependent SIR2 family protein deacetylase
MAAIIPPLLHTVAEGIKSGSIRTIIVLTGAGTSVASGIPDFRSPGGMYSTLRPDLLTATSDEQASMAEAPTDVVSWSLFQHNQLPYLEVRRPFILGTAKKTWQPTLAHAFFALLDKKGLLRRLYTQNIDGLDRMTPIRPERIVNVHGSLDRAECEFCGATVDFGVFCEAVRRQIKDIYGADKDDAPTVSTPILCRVCGRPGVKPATVLYGRSLPDAFHHAVAADFPCRGGPDLMIIAGAVRVVVIA